MTSQLALMNKMAVALASDSAVTIGEKTYNNVQKIFSLDGKQPIGFMISGVATYIPCDIHWKRIIKLFSDEMGDHQFKTLSECVEKFKNFVSNEPKLAPNSENDISIQLDLIGFAEGLLQTKHKEQLDEVVRNVSGDLYDEYPGLDAHISKTILDRVDFFHNLLQGRKEKLNEEQKHKHFRIIKQNKNIIKYATEFFCKKHDISDKNRKKINFIMSFHLAEYSTLYASSWRTFTTLVIAGFGTEQLTPQLYELSVGAIVDEQKGAFYDGDVHRIRTREKMSDFGDAIIDEQRGEGNDWSAAAFIIPYAQNNEIQNILNGIHDDFINRYLQDQHPKHVAGEILLLLDNTIKNIDGIGPKTYSKITDSFKESIEAVRESVKSENKDAAEHFRLSRRQSFRHSSKSMSALQLSEFAKKLVAMEAEITYYSKAKKSVGGEIISATITKENGFIIQ